MLRESCDSLASASSGEATVLPPPRFIRRKRNWALRFIMSPHVSLGNKSVMIYLPTALVQESRHLGLNMSRISQNALTDAITKLDGSYRSPKDSVGVVWRARRDSNPGPQAFLTACSEGLHRSVRLCPNPGCPHHIINSR